MSTTSIEGIDFVTGQRMTMQQLDALPIGSKVVTPGGNHIEKFRLGPSNDRTRKSWRHTPGGTETTLKSGYNRLVSIGDHDEDDEVPGPNVRHFDGERCEIGATMSGPQLDALPVGSVVKDPPGQLITKIADRPFAGGNPGWAYDYMGTPGGLSAGYNTLVSFGGPDPEVRAEVTETLASFKARFAARVREVTEEFTDTHRRVSERVLRDLDAGSALIGQTVAEITGAVANGTVAMAGSPDTPGFTIWRMDDGQWVRQYGPGGEVGACIVTSAPDGDDGDLDEFKARVWAAGQAVKQRYKWCSVFDTVLGEFGIFDPEPGPDFSNWPTLVKAQEGRDKLLLGAVIGENKGDWGIFIKTSQRHNGPDDWTRVCGTRPVAAGTMRLLSRGGVVSILNAAPLLAFMPTGTVIRGANGTYTKDDDGMWVGLGTFASDKFGRATIIGLP